MERIDLAQSLKVMSRVAKNIFIKNIFVSALFFSVSDAEDQRLATKFYYVAAVVEER